MRAALLLGESPSRLCGSSGTKNQTHPDALLEGNASNGVGISRMDWSSGHSESRQSWKGVRTMSVHNVHNRIKGITARRLFDCPSPAGPVQSPHGPAGAAGKRGRDREGAIPDFFGRRSGKGRHETNEPYAWAANMGGRPVGLLGMIPCGNGAVRIRWFRVEPEWAHTAVVGKLIRRLYKHCRRQGYLRVVAESRLAPQWLWGVFERRGFRLKTRRGIVGGEELEFVLDFNAKLS